MTLHQEIRAACVAAEERRFEAAKLRRTIRRKYRPGGTRETVILAEMERISAVTPELRRLIGRLLYANVSNRDEERLRRVSKQIQYEREQLRKMRRPATGGTLRA